MDAHETALRRFFESLRDRPFTVAQAAGALRIDEDSARKLLARHAQKGQVSELVRDRFIYSNSADVVAYNMFLEVAPNVTFQEYVAHRDEPHVLARLSRDRDIAKGLKAEER
ncbi:MAG: hypothetical protein HZB92_07115 [Euryarchaeota archaeon]|nr:hypothetical protein [Euryarchaeota archaeon]